MHSGLARSVRLDASFFYCLKCFAQCFWVLVFLTSSTSRAQSLANSFTADASLSAAGYSGLGITPSPTPLAWGTMAAAYDTAIPGASYPKGHNYLFSGGLLPALEITGRLTTNDHNCNLYGIGSSCPSGSFRDLSASAKAGWQMEVASRTWAAASVGMTDFGGAATYFRSYYAVAGVKQSWWGVSGGYAKAVSNAAPLNGLFGHITLKPWEAAQIYAEKVGARSWLGAKIEVPWGEGAKSRLYVSANKSLQNDGFTPKHWWSVGFSIPFEQPTSLAQAKAEQSTLSNPLHYPQQNTSLSLTIPLEAKSVAKESVQKDENNSTEIDPKLPNFQTAGLLATALAKAGFESISIGQDDKGPIVKLENFSYNWNQLDALGVAMGVVTQKAFHWPTTRLQIWRHGIPIYLAVGKPACMFSWLEQTGYDCGTTEGVQLWAGQHAQFEPDSSASWWVLNERSSTGRTKMFITPAMDSRVGTEYGTFDSTWGVNFTWQTPLWQGATADVAYVKSVGHSNDYAPGGIFSDFRIDSLLHRVMVHQTVALPLGLSARVAYGRLAQVLQGHHSELRWESLEGLHRISFESSQFAHRDVDFKKEFSMATYRYAIPRLGSTLLGSTLELKSGTFWHGDKGQMVVSRHWFGDTNLSVYLRRSQFPVGAPALFSPYGSVPVTSAGIELSIPLTPRREVQAEWLQPRGDDRFSYGLQSVIRAKNKTNYVTPYFGVFSPVPLGLDGVVYNFDRGSQSYLMANLARVRQAWRQLGPID